MSSSTPEEEVNLDSPIESTPLATPSPDLAEPSASPLSAPSPNLPRPALRSISTSGATAAMTASSTPLGTLNAARRPVLQQPPPISSRGSGLNVSQDILARIQAVHLTRQGAPPPNNARNPSGTPLRVPGLQTGPNSIPGIPNIGSPPPTSPNGPIRATPGGIPSNFKMPPGMASPAFKHFQSAPAVPNIRMGGGKPSLAEKRGQILPGSLPRPVSSNTATVGGRKKPGLKLSQMGADTNNQNGAGPSPAQPQGSMMDQYAEYIDTKTGTLKFKGKATINAEGVQFSGGRTFSISLDEVDTLDELGKGNYGTVYKVRHSRPRIRKPGQGLAGNKSIGAPAPSSPTNKAADTNDTHTGGTGVVMAMKEMRLELDNAKFATIIMELDILHRCASPYIIDFYGAFFQEGAVYICMEFMDGGSIDKLYADGIPEGVLRKIALATTMGLKTLKEEHNIIHRDVKPTNILMNTRGQIKICDFGVSGNLVASIAKTNIGCQSYMAPERISSGGIAQVGANPGGGTYSVQSDIWSLGLTIIECAMGRYPYPPETYNNIFSQLSAIVDGEPPDLPEEGYSDAARNFVRGCLNKIPNLRPTYAMLLQHAWLAPLVKPAVIPESDEEDADTDDVASADSIGSAGSDDRGLYVDKEVARWVIETLERKKNGTLGKGKNIEKPALHAAPLDAMSSPVNELANGVSPPASEATD